MSAALGPYPARLQIDYPEHLDRLTTAFRIILAIPIVIIVVLITGGGSSEHVTATGESIRRSSGGLWAGLAFATALMIVVRQKYPRWWFDFARELARFGTRVSAYLLLLTDRYPSTTDEQSVHLEIDYPEVERDLNRWMPLVKWLLALPHYVALALLIVSALVAAVMAWVAIIVTGRYPRGLFDFVVGVMRWGVRVQAYMLLLVTDRYPPFSLR